MDIDELIGTVSSEPDMDTERMCFGITDIFVTGEVVRLLSFPHPHACSDPPPFLPLHCLASASPRSSSLLPTHAQTPARYAQAWHAYALYGRVRPWDDLVVLLHVEVLPADGSGALSTVFCRYVVSERTLIDAWQQVTASTHTAPLEDTSIIFKVDRPQLLLLVQGWGCASSARVSAAVMSASASANTSRVVPLRALLIFAMAQFFLDTIYVYTGFINHDGCVARLAFMNNATNQNFIVKHASLLTTLFVGDFMSRAAMRSTRTRTHPHDQTIFEQTEPLKIYFPPSLVSNLASRIWYVDWSRANALAAGTTRAGGLWRVVRIRLESGFINAVFLFAFVVIITGNFSVLRLV
ncbi:uncharacterized protein BXZ73DRAFT_105625 [Epithele typhae]|uniref:uncharacterized protein n=1 Tax=Epithele typhae TaxID=378194 RepID=UPI0020081315|nr:uncharacterized protein BXZ73DRAFT_110941 [Epithele typhae]XP_047873569.1 uncharacterized protein BXZ73DRAFT_105625 [Epithele typhae]KAH9905509.1 hypothetical protein BXZ73DRAFT_110941 [Epithele typhae]KAH9917153.1 hypothetical protein BXZ73DRAFT_105625 [Epithele typhae]